jgi:hypothetical protein
MGYWTVVVQGCGQHHNSKAGTVDERDADVQADNFVRTLLATGQEIKSAEFTHSGRNDLLRAARPDTKEASAQPATGAARNEEG